MEDILTSIIGIAIAAILMFIFPLMSMSDRTDDVSQLTVDIATNEFADEVRLAGKITADAYNKYIENLGSTGNTYNVEIEVRVLDENPSRKSIQSNSDDTEKLYYSVYTSQIEDTLNKKGTYYLKEGDIITVSAKNTNQTIAQQLKNFFYTVVGSEIYTIASSHSGMVIATGS